MIDEDTILTKKRFTKMIEECVVEKEMTYMESILYVCEQRGLDPGEIGKFITPPVKQKLEAEAVELKLIQGGNQLPV